MKLKHLLFVRDVTGYVLIEAGTEWRSIEKIYPGVYFVTEFEGEINKRQYNNNKENALSKKSLAKDYDMSMDLIVLSGFKIEAVNLADTTPKNAQRVKEESSPYSMFNSFKLDLREDNNKHIYISKKQYENFHFSTSLLDKDAIPTYARIFRDFAKEYGMGKLSERFIDT